MHAPFKHGDPVHSGGRREGAQPAIGRSLEPGERAELLATLPKAETGSDYEYAGETDDVKLRNRASFGRMPGLGEDGRYAERGEPDQEPSPKTGPRTRDVVSDDSFLHRDPVLGLIVGVGQDRSCASRHEIIELTQDVRRRDRALIVLDLGEQALLLPGYVLPSFPLSAVRRHRRLRGRGDVRSREPG